MGEQKLPVILYDCDKPMVVLCIIMVPDMYNASVVNDIVKGVKAKYPGEWTIEDILLEISNRYPEFDIYNCQDIYKYEV